MDFFKLIKKILGVNGISIGVFFFHIFPKKIKITLNYFLI